MPSRLPEWIAALICGASEYEQEVRQAVQITDHLGISVVDAKNMPLGPAADSPADMELCSSAIPAGKDERIQGLQSGVDLIAYLFKPPHVFRVDPKTSLVLRVVEGNS